MYVWHQLILLGLNLLLQSNRGIYRAVQYNWGTDVSLVISFLALLPVRALVVLFALNDIVDNCRSVAWWDIMAI